MNHPCTLSTLCVALAFGLGVQAADTKAAEPDPKLRALVDQAIAAIKPDKPEKQKGGNRCACHAADPKEVAAGDVGPSPTGYGKLRGTGDDIVKYTYEKSYNPQAFTACSNMPRRGHNGILKPEQIADITASLISPESPVDKEVPPPRRCAGPAPGWAVFVDPPRDGRCRSGDARAPGIAQRDRGDRNDQGAWLWRIPIFSPPRLFRRWALPKTKGLRSLQAL